MTKKNILLLLLLSITCTGVAATGLNLIPQPQRLKINNGHFQIDEKTVICYDEDDKTFKYAASYLAAELKKKTGLTIEVKTAIDPDSTNSILFGLERHAEERYILSVSSDHIEVAAFTPQGAFYAAVTILQLLENKTIPCLEIADWPRFEWRGLMLDCSRTFQSVDYIKKTIDLMAFYKMNVLHLHLTDDQGWRIEIKKYPELTQKGATFPEKYGEPERHQGYYTQQQMKELVEYAALRNIRIIPEIEMPGHSLAVLSCRPELSCTGGPFEIFPFFKGPGITSDIYCAGNEATFTFLEDVLSEVFDLFPSEFVHIGGDEAPKSRWKSCSKCQTRIKNEGLKDEHELQSYFIKRIERFANSKGKRIIGWDEILEGGLAPNAAVMSWRGINGGIAAARTGHDVVMSPTSHCYFDYTYKAINTQRAYSFEPVPDALNPDQQKHILGLQANFWSHIDREENLVDRQLWPRLLAIAERGWSSKETRNFDDFQRRVGNNLKHLRDSNVTYKKEVTYQTVGQWTPDTVTEKYAPITFDATAHIQKAGDYHLRFEYTSGACRLGIERVELLMDGELESYDVHRGVTGARNENNDYHLKLGQFRPGRKYQIRAFVRSEGGTDSNGSIFFISEVNYDKL